MVTFAPWVTDPAKRLKADRYVDIERVMVPSPDGGPLIETNDILLFIRKTTGEKWVGGNLLLLRLPKCHIILLSGVDPDIGIALDDTGKYPGCVKIRE